MTISTAARRLSRSKRLDLLTARARLLAESQPGPDPRLAELVAELVVELRGLARAVDPED